MVSPGLEIKHLCVANHSPQSKFQIALPVLEIAHLNPAKHSLQSKFQPVSSVLEMKHFGGANHSLQSKFQIVSPVLEIAHLRSAKDSPQSKFQIVSPALEIKHFGDVTLSNLSKFQEVLLSKRALSHITPKSSASNTPLYSKKLPLGAFGFSAHGIFRKDIPAFLILSTPCDIMKTQRVYADSRQLELIDL